MQVYTYIYFINFYAYDTKKITETTVSLTALLPIEGINKIRENIQTPILLIILIELLFN